MAACYNIVCNVPLAGIALVGGLAFPAYLFFTSKSDQQRLSWLLATATGVFLFIGTMLIYG